MHADAPEQRGGITRWLILLVAGISGAVIVAYAGSQLEFLIGSPAARIGIVALFLLLITIRPARDAFPKAKGMIGFLVGLYVVAVGAVVYRNASTHSVAEQLFQDQTSLAIAAAEKNDAKAELIDAYRAYRALREDDREQVRYNIADISLRKDSQSQTDRSKQYTARPNDIDSFIAGKMFALGWRLCNSSAYSLMPGPRDLLGRAAIVNAETHVRVHHHLLQIMLSGYFGCEGD